MNRRRGTKLAAAVVAVLFVAGCAAQKAYRHAEIDGRRGDWDRAVLGYSKALALDPGNTRYGVALERAKLKASARHFEKGKRFASAAQWDLAVAEFQQTLLLNPGNQHAATELERAMLQIRRRDSGPSLIEQAKERARRESLAPPRLSPASNIPIVMKFEEQPVGKIFEAIGKASGLNFIFDDKTELTKNLSIDIGSVSLEKALDILMLQTKNFFKVIDEHTLLVAPDNRQKRQEYEDQVIRTFYLSNAETKQVVSVIRTLLSSRQVAENDQLNSVTIKDTPDKVAIAERIINANDKSKGEIVIDVELLEINRTVTKNLGLDLSSKTLSLSFRGGDESLPLNNLRVLKQRGNWLVGPIPSAIINFLKTDSENKTIAKPSLRVTEGEKAEILIGDRVPIPTTSFNTSQTIGGNIVPVTSFTYQNVGITVQLEPRVHHNKEVTLKVSVEVSQITSFVEASGGQQQPIIGTRQIQTVIRLRDGETNLLAGLIKKEETDTRSGVPGVLNLPGLSRIFSNQNVRDADQDIILTLTPYIIRIPDITEDDLATLWVGTEDNIQLRGPAKNALNQSPFWSPEEDAASPEAGAAPTTTGGRVTRMAPSDESAVPDQAAPADEGADEPVESEPAAPLPPGGSTGGPRGTPPADEAGEEGDSAEGTEPDIPSGPATVRLVPSQGAYRVGDVVSVQVVLENGTNVASVPFHLRYNREVLEYIPNPAEGDFLRMDGANTVFLANDTPSGGEVIVGLSRMGAGAGVDGSGSLATFQFQAVNPGNAAFAFISASVKDPQARNLPATFIGVPIAVAE